MPRKLGPCPKCGEKDSDNLAYQHTVLIQMAIDVMQPVKKVGDLYDLIAEYGHDGNYYGGIVQILGHCWNCDHTWDPAHG